MPDINKTSLADVLMVNTKRFCDERGYFTEHYNQAAFTDAGIPCHFVQDNRAFSSAAGTIRGLHFQAPPMAQAKLVSVMHGRIFDVAIDLRPRSRNCGKSVGVELDAETGQQLYIPVGFAHGYLTLTPNCEVMYKVDNFYAPEYDHCIGYDDPAFNIKWPLGENQPILSERDARATLWNPDKNPFACLKSDSK